MPLSSTLLALHDIIQAVVGWTDSHLFEFVIGASTASPCRMTTSGTGTCTKAAGIRLKSLIERGDERFLYVYDFGDDWTGLQPTCMAFGADSRVAGEVQIS